MKKRTKILLPALLLAVIVMLCGCVRTVDELYRVPRRSVGYRNLQAAMEQQMESLSFCAPGSGENQQAVQMADLNGDGIEEVILFAKANDDRPLKILIFSFLDGDYSLTGKIECAGAAFNQVEYVQMDGKPGLEIVVCTELSDQLPRNISVHGFSGGAVQELLSTECRRFLCCDLDGNGVSDLLVLNAGEDASGHGTVTLFGMTGEELLPWGSATLSRSIENMKRIMTGGLSGGQQAVFVASAADEDTIVTDVFALVDGKLTNISQASESGTGVNTLRNLYVYGEDIDHDGEMELPSLISVKAPSSVELRKHGEHLIRWYAMTAQGEEVTKLYTYHNYQQLWYMTLRPDTARRICVVHEDDGSYSFLLWNEEGTGLTKLWTVYVLTGDDRSALAAKENRFILMKTDSAVYAAMLEPAAQDYGITAEDLIEAFHLIRRGWKTGEM